MFSGFPLPLDAGSGVTAESSFAPGATEVFRQNSSRIQNGSNPRVIGESVSLKVTRLTWIAPWDVPSFHVPQARF